MCSRNVVTALFLSFGVLAVAGCGGSNSSSPGPCAAPSGQLVLAYPAPNSTGIPDNFVGVIFATQTPLPSSYQALVLPNGASAATPLLLVAPFTPPLPAPSLTPPFPNPVYQASGSNQVVLPAATTIAVYLNDINSNCTASYVGSFTTR